MRMKNKFIVFVLLLLGIFLVSCGKKIEKIEEANKKEGVKEPKAKKPSTSKKPVAKKPTTKSKKSVEEQKKDKK